MTDKQLNDLLEELIDEATVDCDDEDECLMGFEAVIDEEVSFPFKAKMIGEEVLVTQVYADSGRLCAKCERGGKTHIVSLADLKINSKKVKGYEWLAAYKKWRDRF